MIFLLSNIVNGKSMIIGWWKITNTYTIKSGGPGAKALVQAGKSSGNRCNIHLRQWDNVVFLWHIKTPSEPSTYFTSISAAMSLGYCAPSQFLLVSLATCRHKYLNQGTLDKWATDHRQVHFMNAWHQNGKFRAVYFWMNIFHLCLHLIATSITSWIKAT